MDMRVRDGMLKTVVFIGTVNVRGEFVPNGTGCLISCGTGGRMFQHVATCWHVVRDIAGDKIWIRVNDKKGQATLHWTHKDRWVKHPGADGKGGKIVDLCVSPVTIKEEEHDILHIPIDSDDHVATDQVTAAYQGFRTASRTLCDAPHRHSARSWPKTLVSRLYGS